MGYAKSGVARLIEGSKYERQTRSNIKTGKISVGDKSWSFPIYPGSIGPDVLDIGKFYAETGMFTFDPGFTSTAACNQDHLHRWR